MAQTPEGRVKNQVKKLLKARAPHGCWFFMPVQTGFSAPGIPDFILCYRAFMIGVETKAGKNKPTKAQQFQMKQMREVGEAITLVINEDNQDELTATLDQIDMFWAKLEDILGENNIRV